MWRWNEILRSLHFTFFDSLCSANFQFAENPFGHNLTDDATQVATCVILKLYACHEGCVDSGSPHEIGNMHTLIDGMSALASRSISDTG